MNEKFEALNIQLFKTINDYEILKSLYEELLSK